MFRYFCACFFRGVMTWRVSLVVFGKRFLSSRGKVDVGVRSEGIPDGSSIRSTHVCMVWYDESVWCDVDGKMGSVDSETGVILLMEMMN